MDQCRFVHRSLQIPSTLTLLTVGPLMQLAAAAELWSGLAAGAAFLAVSCGAIRRLSAQRDGDFCELSWPQGRSCIKLLELHSGTLKGLETRAPWMLLEVRPEGRSELTTIRIDWPVAADLRELGNWLAEWFTSARTNAAPPAQARPKYRGGYSGSERPQPSMARGRTSWGQVDDWFE